MNPGEILFERFRLDTKLGEGGMGVVWRAYDSRLEQRVALKFLPSGLADDPGAIALLKHEAQKAIQLTHPHIVRVHDLHIAPGLVAVAMEWIDGSTMHQLQRFTPTGVFQPGDLPILLQQFISALSYAHEKRGMIHRDLKPANLMINREGELKIADFGIAAPANASATKMHGLSGSGTPAYMSPQQVMGEPPDPTDDIYSFGATLFDLLTGAPPFFEGNIVEQLFKKNAPRVEDRRREFGLPNPAINPTWEAVIASCLAKNPADRPQTAREVGIRLRLADLAVLGNSAGQLQQLVSHHFDRVDRQEPNPGTKPPHSTPADIKPRPDLARPPANPILRSNPALPADPSLPANISLPSLPSLPHLSQVGRVNPNPEVPVYTAIDSPSPAPPPPGPPQRPSTALEPETTPSEHFIGLTAYPVALAKNFLRTNRTIALTALGILVLIAIYFALRPAAPGREAMPSHPEPAAQAKPVPAPAIPQAEPTLTPTAGNGPPSPALAAASAKLPPGPLPFSYTNTASFGPANNILRLITDPKRSRIYALQQNGSDDGVIFVLDPITYEAISALQVGQQPSDLSLSGDANELLVICVASKSISVVELSSLRLTGTIRLPEFGEHGASAGAGHLKHGPGDIIYYTDGSWSPVLRVFSRNTGKVIQSVLLDGNKPNNSGGFGFGDFMVTPDKRALFAWGQTGWGAGSAGSNVARFKINSNGTLARTQTGNLSYPAFLRDPLGTPVLITTTGDRVFIKQHQFASTSIAGPMLSFPSPVYAISAQGEIVVTGTDIYVTATGQKVYQLPSACTVQAISPDNSRLVYFDPASRQLKALDLGVALNAAVFNPAPAPVEVVGRNP